MGEVQYEEVVRLVEQLLPQQQAQLVEHLQMMAHQRELSFEAWDAALQAMIDRTPVIGDFPARREDWYQDLRLNRDLSCE